MTLSNLAYSIARYSRDFDSYSFDDCFDTLEEGADQIMFMLCNEPETVFDALARMLSFASDEDEAKQGTQLLAAVFSLAKSAA